MHTPLISVIIPAHNNAQTIGTAIDSILTQTYKNLEILIVDDNSTDGTKAVADRYAKQHVSIQSYALPYDDPHRVNSRGRNVNAGYMARNYALTKTNGEWITFQDADDASLPNRIEAQYILATRYNSAHVCIEWQQLRDDNLSKTFDFEKALNEQAGLIISTEDILKLARKTKGIAMSMLGPLRKYVPFEFKRARISNKLFFGSLASYPASGNSPLCKKEVIEKVQFRNVDERVWPSFTGRGADRDFNFQVAETFKNSMCFKLPLYLYRSDRENILGYAFERYM